MWDLRLRCNDVCRCRGEIAKSSVQSGATIMVKHLARRYEQVSQARQPSMPRLLIKAHMHLAEQ
jgi:hypothetical protein